MGRFTKQATLVEEERKPRFGGTFVIEPERLPEHPQQPPPSEPFSLFEPQEITLPSGEKRTIDVLTPGVRRAALETGLSVLAELAIPVPGTGVIPKMIGTAIRRTGVRSGVGAAAGSLAAEPFDPSESPFLQAGIAGGIGTGGEMAGRFGAAVVNRFLGRSPHILPGIDEAQSILRARGASLTGAQATSAVGTDVIENISEAALLGGGRIKTFKERAVQAGSEALEDFVGAIRANATKEEVGVLIQDAVDAGAEAFTRQGEVLYGLVDDVAPAGIDITAFQEEALEELVKSQRGLKSSAIEDLTEDIIGRDGTISFAEASAIRSDLGQFGATGTETIKGKAQGAAKKLFKSIDKAIDDAGRAQNLQGLEQWREATAFWKAGKKKWNSRLIKSLTQRDPETVFDAVVKRGRPGTIREIRGIVGDPEQWRAIQGQYLDDWMRGAVDDTGELQGNRLIRRLGQFGDEALKELFPGGELVRLKEFARTIQLAQSRTEAGHFRLAVQFSQAGVATAFVLRSAVTAGEVGTIFLGPALLARIYTSKLGFRFLVQGINAPAGSAAGLKAATKFFAFVNKQRISETAEEQIERLKSFAGTGETLRQAVGQ